MNWALVHQTKGASIPIIQLSQSLGFIEMSMVITFSEKADWILQTIVHFYSQAC